MRNQLQKAINLAKKTGDRLIIFDNLASDNGYVVMSLDEYEKILSPRQEIISLTEEELLDKINRDIAIWKSENDSEKVSQVFNEFLFNREEPNRGFDEIGPTIQRQEQELEKRVNPIRKKGNQWAIPEARKKVETEEDNEPYLEEITF